MKGEVVSGGGVFWVVEAFLGSGTILGGEDVFGVEVIWGGGGGIVWVTVTFWSSESFGVAEMFSVTESF